MIGQQRLPFPEGDDVGKGRFGQQELFDARAYEPPEPTPQRPQPTHKLDASRPFSEGGAVGTEGWGAFTPWKRKVNPTAEDWAAVGPSQSRQEWIDQGAHTKVHPGQFQMFMTPHEIRTKYQALDADRQDAEPWRAGEMTMRSETTAGEPNITANTNLRERWARWHGGMSQVADYKYARNEDYAEETDDALYSRKLEESQMSPRDYADVHLGGWEEREPPDMDAMSMGSLQPPREPSDANTSAWDRYHSRDESYGRHVESRYDRKMQEWEDEESGASLHDQIRAEGVKSPIHLSYAQMGNLGKNQVVGGHHRLAASEDIDPHQPIPVQHWKNIQEAKGSGRYT